MRLEQVKNQSELVLEGIEFECDIVGSEIRRLKLTDKKGRVLQFEGSGYDREIKTFRPASPKKKKIYEVVFAVAGEKFTREFDQEYAAKTFREGTGDDNATISEKEVDDE